MASTLYTLLVKLGLDTGELKAEGRQAAEELRQIGRAAQQAGQMASPAAAALNNLAKAANAVQGSKGAQATVEGLAAAADRVIVSTNGSAGALNNMAKAASAIGAATGNGAVLNNFARGIVTVAAATEGSVSALNAFSKGAMGVAAATGGSATAINKFIAATVAAAQAGTDAAGAIEAVKRTAQGGAPSLQQVAQASRAAAGGLESVAKSGGAAASGLNNTANAARNASSGLQGVQPAAVRTAGTIADIGTQAEHTTRRVGYMQRVMSMAFAFGGGVAVTTLFGFLAQATLGFNSRLEQAHIAFETLLGDAAKADVFINQMKKFAEVTPFEFEGLEMAVQRLMAMGFTAEQTLPTLRAVGDAVAALGGNTEKLDRITIALGQMMTAGKVNAQDMRQLTEAGIPAWQMLADAIGKTVAETRKMGEQGLISSATAIPAILEGMDERFGGLMERQARTAQGAFSTIRDYALITLSTAVEPLFKALSQGMLGLADFFINGGGDQIIPIIQGIGVALTVALIPALWNVVAAAGAATVAIAGVTVPIIPLAIAVSTLGVAWQNNFLGMRTVLEPIVEGLYDLASAVAQFVASSGVLLPIIQAIAVIVGVRLVAGFTANAAAMAWNAAAAVALSGAFTGLTVTSTAASRSVGLLAMGMRGLSAAAALVGGPITLVVAAVVLLITNLQQVGQGIRVVQYNFLSFIETLLNAAEAVPGLGIAFGAVGDQVTKMKEQVVADMRAVETAINEAASAGGGSETGAQMMDRMRAEMDQFLASFQNMGNGAVAEAQSLVEQFGTTMQGVVEAAKNAGGEAMEEMAAEIRAHQNAPMEALQALHDMVRDQMDPMTEIIRLYAMKTGPDIAAGMASGDAAVRAQTEATVKIIEERLAELTGVAVTTGAAVTNALAASIDPVSMGAGARDKWWITGGGAQAAQNGNNINNAWKGFIPTQQQILDAQKKINAELSSSAYQSGLSALNSAFNDIERAAKRYFDEVHRGNLQAIDDALEHKNALLDAKAALNQAPVTAAQKALDFQRDQIQEWRLREAIRTANSPEQYRDAILALQDFLMQKHIDEMQAQVDAANEAIDIQKQSNQDQAEEQRNHENERYQRQVETFERELELLRRYLAAHPGEWQNAEAQIMGLLKSYGIDYRTAGSNLGANFVAGLREHIQAAKDAVREMADLIPGGTGSGTGGGGIYTGIFGPGGEHWVSPGASTPGETINPYTGFKVPQQNTYQFFIGDEQVGEVVDKALQNQDDTYGGGGGTVTVKAIR